MRRIAAAALTAGTMIVGVAATAAPAEAATKFTSPNGTTAVTATGTFSRSSSKTTISFKLQDNKKDGYAACVRFKFTEGNSIHYQKLWLERANKSGKLVPDDRKGAYASTKISDTNTTHLYVQECLLPATAAKKKGGTKYGRWGKLF